MDIGRNDPCRCGSKKKYKKCCMAKDEAKEREVLDKKWAEAAEKKKREDARAEKPQEGKAPAAPRASEAPHIAKGGSRKYTPYSGTQVRIPPKTGGG